MIKSQIRILVVEDTACAGRQNLRDAHKLHDNDVHTTTPETQVVRKYITEDLSGVEWEWSPYIKANQPKISWIREWAKQKKKDYPEYDFLEIVFDDTNWGTDRYIGGIHMGIYSGMSFDIIRNVKTWVGWQVALAIKQEWVHGLNEWWSLKGEPGYIEQLFDVPEGQWDDDVVHGNDPEGRYTAYKYKHVYEKLSTYFEKWFGVIIKDMKLYIDSNNRVWASNEKGYFWVLDPYTRDMLARSIGLEKENGEYKLEQGEPQGIFLGGMGIFATDEPL